MFKLIGHAIFFALGAGAGIYWGVHHPTQAADLANDESVKIQQAVAAAKQQVLQQVVAEQNTPAPGGSPPGTPAAATSHLNKYQEMLNKAQAEFNAATAKSSGQ